MDRERRADEEKDVEYAAHRLLKDWHDIENLMDGAGLRELYHVTQLLIEAQRSVQLRIEQRMNSGVHG